LFEDVYQNRTIHASFSRYTIQTNTPENGQIEPSGIVEIDVDGFQTFTITPHIGYEIDNVLIDAQSIGVVDEYTFWNVNDYHTIEVSFKALPHFSITAVSTDCGHISPQGIIDILQGDHIVFDIIPETDCILNELWVDAEQITPKSTVFFTSVDQDHSISAVFLSIPTYTITSQATEGGSISPRGTIHLKENEYQLFEMQANPGFRLADVIIDQQSNGSVNYYALVAHKNQDIMAKFEKIVLITVMGIVRDSETHDPLPNFMLELYQSGDIIQVMPSNESGSYSFSQITYMNNLMLGVLPSNNDYQWQSFDIQGLTPDTLHYELNPDMNVLSTKGFSGHVMYKNEGVNDVLVDVFSNDNNYRGSAVTDETGYYEIKGLPQGSDYMVSIDHTTTNTKIYYAIPESLTPGELPSYSVFLENQATPIQPADPLLENIDIIIDMGGVISGCLQWHNEEPVSGVWVSAWSESLQFGNSAMSDRKGCYTITGLLPVSEYLAYTNGYIVEISSDALPSLEYQQGIHLPTNRHDIHFTIDQQIAIAGLIVDQLGHPMENVVVMAWSVSDDAKTGNAISNQNGCYTIMNLLPADDYQVAVYPEHLPAQYYHQVTDPKEASTIVVNQSMVTDINFSLNKKSRIHGRVYLVDTIATNGLWLDIASKTTTYRASVQTDSDGHYEFMGLDPDIQDYIIHLEYPGFVTFQSSELSPSEDEFTIYLQRGLTVRGNIFSSNQIITNATIILLSDNGLKYVENSTLSSPFNYTLTGLLQGEYHITVSHDNYESQEIINFKLYSNMDYLNFYLQQSRRQLSGIILGLETGHTIRLNAWSDIKHAANFVNVIGTGKPVFFEIPDLPSSEDYRLEVISTYYEYQAYDNQKQWEDADMIDLSTSDVSTIMLELIPLIEKPTITGKIAFPEGNYVGVKVIVEAQSQILDQAFRTEILGNDDLSGHTVPYTLLGLSPATDYIVSVVSIPFQKRYYPDAILMKDAEQLTVSDSKFPDQINFTLKKGGLIAGKIQDDQLQGIENIDISALSLDTGVIAHTRSYTDGHYAIQGLPALSDYIVFVRIPDKGIFYYHSKGSVRNSDMATRISLLEQDQLDMNITTEVLSCISGKVIDRSGNGLEDLWVEVFSQRFQIGNASFSLPDGQFNICGLPESQDYQISIKPPANSLWNPFIQDGITSPSSSNNLILSQKQMNMFTISGIITNINKQPVPQTKIVLHSLSDKDFYLHTKSKKNGYFEWQDIPKGNDYLISAYPPENANYAIYHSEPFPLTDTYQTSIVLNASLSISGNIIADASDQPVDNARVNLYATERDFQAEIHTDSNGEYKFTKLENANDYVVVVNHDSYLTARKEAIPAGETLDFRLTLSSRICGQIKNKVTGKAIPNAAVEVYSYARKDINGYFGSVNTDSLGNFCIQGLISTDSQGKPVNDYIATAIASGFPPFSLSIPNIDRPANFFLFKGKENEISGTINDMSSFYCFVDIIDSKEGFLITLPVMPDGNFVLFGLSPGHTYKLIFLAYNHRFQEVYRQWAGFDDIHGIDTGVDEDNAKLYRTGDILVFQFNSTVKRSRAITEEKVDSVGTVETTTPIVQLSSDDLSITSSVRDLVSRDSVISVEWNTDQSVQGFYYAFNTETDYRIDKRNVAKVRPTKIRKAQSAHIYADDEYYYFHVAPVTDRGRIGPTTTAAFRIDNTAPTNVMVNVPVVSDSRDIEIKLGASGANEVYISNSGFENGGKWQLIENKKNWKLLPGNGLKPIYVRFRDRAQNIVQAMASTDYQEPVRQYTIETSFDNHGTVEVILPQTTENQIKRIKDTEYTVPEGSKVQLKIHPHEGYVIDAVLVNDKRVPLFNDEYTFDNIDQHKRVRITFKPIEHIITATSGVYGQIEPSGEIHVNHGENQTFSFIPLEGTRLAQLIVDGRVVETTENYTFNEVDQHHTIMAVFVQVYHIEATHGDNGAISPAGTIMIDQGYYQTFQFLPDWGYEVDTVTINDEVLPTRPNTYSCLNVSRNHKLDVTFKRVQLMIGATTSTGGTLTPSGNIMVYMGDDQTFTFFPDFGYTLKALIVDGLIQALDQNTYTFEKIESNHSLAVSYKAIEFHIFTSSGTGGSIQPSGAVSVIKGRDQSFTVQPSSGYVLKTVLLDDTPIQHSGNTIVIPSVMNDHDLRVTFKQVHTLSVMAGPNGQITPSGTIQVSHGNTRSFLLTPDDGYTISTITIDSQEVAYTDHMIILENIISDHTIVASYTPICHIIASQAYENGKIEPQGYVSVNEGQSQTFTIIPDQGFEILNVLIDSQAVELTQNHYTFTNVRETHDIQVIFQRSNHEPVARNMDISLFEDHIFTGILQANDPDNNPLTFTILQFPQLGDIILPDRSTGLFVYTPTSNVNGSDQFTFKVSDGIAEASTATVNLWITSVNDIPVGQAYALTLNEDSSIQQKLLALDIENDTLSFSIATHPQMGDVILNEDIITYYPKANFFGKDRMSYQVSDTYSQSSNIPISLTILPVNDPPVLETQYYRTGKNSAVDIVLSASDIDSELISYTVLSPQSGKLEGNAPELIYTPDTDYEGEDFFVVVANDGIDESLPITISLFIGATDVYTKEDTPVSIKEQLTVLGNPENIHISKTPAHGNLSGYMPDMTYTPNSNFFGDDIIWLTLDSDSQPKKIAIYVEAVNDTPVLSVPGSVQITEDTTKIITIEAYDIENDALTIEISEWSHGYIVTDRLPVLELHPEKDYVGKDMIVIQLSDESSFVSQPVQLIVNGVNDSPIAYDQSIATMEDMPIAITLLASDIDSTTLHYQYTQTTFGIVSGEPPVLLYTPKNNWFGTDQLIFQVNDGHLTSLTATVDIRVKAVNDPPMVYAKIIDLDEDIAVTFTLNATDPDDDPLTFIITEQSQQGRLDILNATTGEFQYTPRKDYSGNDCFKVNVSDGTVNSNTEIIYLTIAPVNDPPVLADSLIQTFEDQSISYTLAAVDQDSNGLSYSLIQQAVKGKVSLNQKTGAFIYTPFPDANGNDAFTVISDDGLSQSEIALISVRITPVNDPPVAHNATLNTTEDQWIESTLIAQDIDSITLTFQVIQTAQKGNVEILDAQHGIYRYTSDLNANGFDTFVFMVHDSESASCTGIVSIQIMAENDPPEALTCHYYTLEDHSISGQLTAIDPDNDNLVFTLIKTSNKGTITLTDPAKGQFVYIPFANVNGLDVLSFQVNDGQLASNTADISIAITPVNDPPEVISQELETDENTPLNIKLSGTDIDSETINFEIMALPENGTISGANANWNYIPSTDYWGVDQFEFVAKDQNSQSSKGKIYIRVGVPEADIYVAEDQSIDISSELGFDPTIVNAPENGTINQFIYTPHSNYNGFDRFGYIHQSDDNQESIIYIKPVNDPPKILDITPNQLELNEDTTQTLNIKAVDVDHELSELICRIIQQPEHGHIIIDQMAISYHPITHYFGSDSFIYQISDGLSYVSKEVNITIIAVNDSPVAKDIALEMMEDQSIDIIFSATDIEQNALSYTIIDYPDHGIVIDNHQKTYWPDADYWGWDTLTYVANDGLANSNAVTISIYVFNVNDSPKVQWDMVETHANSSVIGKLLASDVDYQDTLTFKIIESPTKGKFQINEQNGGFSFWAYETASGLDRLTFLVNDGTVNSEIAGITIVIQSEPPNIAPIARDSDLITYKNGELNGRLKASDGNQDRLMFFISKYPNNGIFIMNNPTVGSFSYYPNRDVTGTDTIDFYANDGETDSNIATLSITIKPTTNNQPQFYDLSVQVEGPTQYSYSLIDQQGKLVVDHTFHYSDTFIERLSKGNYRLIILSKDYLPFEYQDETPYITLDQDRNLLVSLMDSPGFDPFKATVDVSHKNHSTGFDLQVIAHNAKTFVWTVNGQSLSLSDYTGSGTSQSPYIYSWQTSMAKKWQEDTPRIGDQTAECQFNFYDGLDLIDQYNVSYIQYGSEDNEEQDKALEQKVFEKGGLYNSKASSITKNKTTFHPLMGTTFHLRVTDPSKKERDISITIPPIPLEYLMCNDPLQPTDQLNIQTSYYTFGPNALATGINLKLFTHNGLYVSLNPSSNRKSDAPIIGLPILLNTTVSQSGNFKAMVCENESTQFESTPLPIVDHGNGYLEIQTNHLSGFGIEMVEEKQSEDSGGSCFIEVLLGDFF
jgi:hypothetical protein